jgi:hypothetical protein
MRTMVLMVMMMVMPSNPKVRVGRYLGNGPHEDYITARARRGAVEAASTGFVWRRMATVVHVLWADTEII